MNKLKLKMLFKLSYGGTRLHRVFPFFQMVTVSLQVNIKPQLHIGPPTYIKDYT